MTVRVAGAAMTRFGPSPEAGVRSLTTEAVTAALADAGVGPGDVGLVAFANAAQGVLEGQEMVRGQVALRHTALAGLPILNVENACASSSSAFHLAWLAVMAGTVEIALAVGVEHLTGAAKARAFAMFATAVDLTASADAQELVASQLLGTTPGQPVTRSPLMDLYAARTRAYMAATGATVAEFAEVAVKNRRHAAGNPRAQFRHPVTVDEVLASRLIADPLRLLMCAPVGDGAAAVVLMSEERARRFGRPTLAVEASVLRSASGGAAVPGVGDAPGGTVARAARAAYETSGIGPLDLDVAEVHDAAAPAELMLYEELGWSAPGDAAKHLRSGDTALGGRLPVNPSGGLLSRGHPVGATGCAQLVELADQLRGRGGARQVAGARLALAQNGGGLLDGEEAACTVTILSA